MRLLIGFLLLLLGAPIQAQSPCAELPTVTFAGWPGDSALIKQGFCLLDEVGDLYYQPGLPDWETYNRLPPYFHTRAIWQNEGVIEGSAAYNNVALNGSSGFVALNSPIYVGSTVWVRQNSAETWLEVVVADTVKREHQYYHAVAVGSGIELGWELAEAFGLTRHSNDDGSIGFYEFEVCVAPVLEECTGTPVDYSAWYLDNVRFE